MQHDANLMQPFSAKSLQPIPRDPAIRSHSRNVCCRNSSTTPVRRAANGADTMKLNDLREIGFDRQKMFSRTAEPPWPQDGNVAAITSLCRLKPNPAADQIPYFQQQLASSVQFCIPPAPRPTCTNLPKSRTNRAKRANPQNPAPARFRAPPLIFAANFVTIVYRTPLPKAGYK